VPPTGGLAGLRGRWVGECEAASEPLRPPAVLWRPSSPQDQLEHLWAPLIPSWPCVGDCCEPWLEGSACGYSPALTREFYWDGCMLERQSKFYFYPWYLLLSNHWTVKWQHVLFRRWMKEIVPLSVVTEGRANISAATLLHLPSAKRLSRDW